MDRATKTLTVQVFRKWKSPSKALTAKDALDGEDVVPSAYVCSPGYFLSEHYPMFEMDHVALPTTDIPATIKFYVENFRAPKSLRRCHLWGLPPYRSGKLALVSLPSTCPTSPSASTSPPLPAIPAALKAGKPSTSTATHPRYLRRRPAGNVLGGADPLPPINRLLTPKTPATPSPKL